MYCKGKIIIFAETIFLLFILSYGGLMALDPGQSIDQYVLDQWGIEQGFPSSCITSIAQTANGYLWFATPKGLIRFDGLKFTTINYTENFKIETKKKIFPDAVFVDKEGNLWIGSPGHLTKYRYQTGQFTTFTNKHGMSGNRIVHIREDIKGNLWIGFMVSYLNRFSEKSINDTGNKFTHFNASNGLEGKKIKAIVEDRTGTLLVGTLENGVFKLRDGKFFKCEIEKLESTHHIYTMYEDKKGVLWIGTNKGLLQVVSTNPEKAADVYLYDTRDGLLSDEIVDIIKDSDENVWVATVYGLNRMKVIKEDQHGGILFEKILEKHFIRRLFEDSEGSLWIGTQDSGLMRLKNAVFIAHAPSTSIFEKKPGEAIMSLYENQQADIWVGSSRGKLYKFRNNECIESLEIPDAAYADITAIREDNHGNLWLGTAGKGLFQRKKGTDSFINFNTRDGLADNIVLSIFNDSKNNLWIGTYDGVSRYRNGVFKSLKAQDGILGKFVNNVYEDKNHHIRIASNKGIYVIEKGELTKINMIEYLPDIPVACIYEEKISSGNDKDSNGSVSWISTHGAGLKRFKDGKFFSFTTAEGMTSNFIYQMLEDERGNLWMMSDSGILRVNKKELNGFVEGRVNRINCTSFGISDGMKSSEFYNFFSRNSALKTREGEFWFVTTKGITIVNPLEIIINKTPPSVIIEEVVFNDHSIPLHMAERKEKIFKEVGDFVFHFTAPTFLSPEKIKFKYKLDGYDRDWVYLLPGEKRTARYKDLAAGTYTFRVTSCNSDGVWNKRGDSITFTLTPLFHESIFFRILVLFILLVMALGGYLLHKKQWLRKIGKYKGSPMNPIYIKECIKKLDYLMEIEKVYRDETISLQSLSGKLSVTPHHLSRILNEKLNKNFPYFINTYRVEEAKKILADPKQTDRKILTIAFDVGFNTKVAFNTAFKKHTNMTPSQFRKKAMKLVRQ